MVLFNKKIDSRPNLSRSLVSALVQGIVLIALVSAFFSGCARVHQKDREFLSDPIMQRQDDPLESRLESHDFPRREGSVGGSAGAGGGCGC